MSDIAGRDSTLSPVAPKHDVPTGSPPIAPIPSIPSIPSTSAVTTEDYRVLRRVVRDRRTNLRIDPDRDIDHSILLDLCELACWAPNHKLTEPWRFAVVRGAARATLGELTARFQLASGDDDEARLNKTRKKYLRSAVVLLIASARSSDEARRSEDRDAVASGVQNVLLGATALGINSYWGTGAITSAPAVKEFAGFGSEDTIVASVYLGWPIGSVPTPNRRPPMKIGRAHV